MEITKDIVIWNLFKGLEYTSLYTDFIANRINFEEFQDKAEILTEQIDMLGFKEIVEFIKILNDVMGDKIKKEMLGHLFMVSKELILEALEKEGMLDLLYSPEDDE